MARRGTVGGAQAWSAPVSVLLLAQLLGLSACAKQAGRVLTPDGFTSVGWSAEEQAREIAVKPMRRTELISQHLIRLRTQEKPHVHRHTDLTVTVLSGKVMMHLGDRDVEVRPGDVIDIPRGTPHWAENIAADASLAFVTFSPPFDGKDVEPLAP